MSFNTLGAPYNLPKPQHHAVTRTFKFCLDGRDGRPDVLHSAGLSSIVENGDLDLLNLPEPEGSPGSSVEDLAVMDLAEIARLSDMHRSEICRLHELFQQLRWHLDVVLTCDTRPGLFESIFKDSTHKERVFGLLRSAQGFVMDFLCRETTNICQRSVLVVDKLHWTDTSTCATVDAPAENSASRYARLTLYPPFWESSSIIDSFFALRFQPNATRLDGVDSGPVATLLHEIVHMESSFWWPDFIGAAWKDDFVWELTEEEADRVLDVTISQAALPADPGDQAIVQRLLADQADDATSYGVKNCMALAQLRRGAAASLMNADSYVVFVSLAVHEYIGNSFMRSPALDPGLKDADDELARLIDEESKAEKLRARIEGGSPAKVDALLAMKSLSAPSAMTYARLKAQLREFMNSPPAPVQAHFEVWWRPGQRERSQSAPSRL